MMAQVSLTPKPVLLSTYPGLGLVLAIEIPSFVQTGARENKGDRKELRQGGQPLNPDYQGH